MRTTVARCYPRLRRIVLSRGALDFTAGQFRELLCHELAHLAAYDLYGTRARPHGAEWRELVASAGCSPSSHKIVRLGGTRQNPEPHKLTVAHTCPVCQTRRLAARAVPGWRCAECRAAGLPGLLEISRVGTR
jgi:SprT protein